MMKSSSFRTVCFCEEKQIKLATGKLARTRFPVANMAVIWKKRKQPARRCEIFRQVPEVQGNVPGGYSKPTVGGPLVSSIAGFKLASE